MAGARLAASSGFHDGTKVGAYERTGDLWPGAQALGKPVKTATSDGTTVEFSGLDAGVRYWAVGEDGRHVAFTAKNDVASKVRRTPDASFDPQKVPQVRDSYVITTGATGTKVAGKLVEVPLPKHLNEAHPHLNQASVGPSVPQRSNTPLGQATPCDPDEPQPKPRQEDVPKRTKQMSATETGEATPIVEEAGPEPQEDASKRLKQRSDTEEGEQTPIGTAEPRGTASNPDSREQAAGVRSTDTKSSATKKAVTSRPKAKPKK